MPFFQKKTRNRRKIPHSEYEILINEIKHMENKYSRLPRIIRDFRKILLQGTKVKEINNDPAIVTMNTTVKIHNLDTNTVYALKIVHPKFEKVHEFKISVLSPVGVSLYAHPVGHVSTCTTGMNKYRLKILDVYDC